MKRDASSPDAELVETLCDLIYEVSPKQPEAIAHGMLDDPGFANLAAQKHYFALCIAPEALAKHNARFAKLDLGKSCLRFKGVSNLDRSDVAKRRREARRVRAKSG